MAAGLTEVLPIRRRAQTRWVVAPIVAVGVVWLLLVLMQWLIRAPEHEKQAQEDSAAVEMVKVQPPKEQAEEQAPQALPTAAPPPPPAAPPSLARTELPSVAAPAMAISSPTVDIAVPAVESNTTISIGTGSGLSGTGAFGGFAGSGSGNGSGAGGGGGGGQGYGHGESFSGAKLVPTSTARPEMPEWACKQHIQGWVEVVFTVLPSGSVTNVRLVDAQPRGVFEAAAIESVAHWIYETSKQTREVKQRVQMDPADCAYNYH